MAEPTAYDEIQDGRLDSLESLITAEYQPPAGTEYSFPVANQGITQEQFRLMFLGQANGIIHSDTGVVNDNPNSTGFRYILERHDSDAETNQRNTLMLRAGTSADSVVEGFYHRLTEDLELPFPPVTTTTVYHVTITYDPREFKTSPLRIHVYPGEPPTSHGRVHLLLHTVERRPNQLLTEATNTRYRPYTAGVVSVQREAQLPPWRGYTAGTLAVPSEAGGRGAFVRTNTIGDWRSIFYGDWVDCAVHFSWKAEGAVRARWTPTGVQLRGRLGADGRTGNTQPMFTLPSDMRISTTFRAPVWATGSTHRMFEASSSGNGRDVYVSGAERPGYVEVNNIFIPAHCLVNGTD